MKMLTGSAEDLNAGAEDCNTCSKSHTAMKNVKLYKQEG